MFEQSFITEISVKTGDSKKTHSIVSAQHTESPLGSSALAIVHTFAILNGITCGEYEMDLCQEYAEELTDYLKSLEKRFLKDCSNLNP